MLQIQVLDHGYVKFIEAWGQGEASTRSNTDYEVGIIEAARQSTQGSFRGWEEDKKLLNFLHINHHDTPFEFAGMVIEVRAPIFVFREWHRHRTQSYNEMSARYSPMPDVCYVPSVERLMRTSTTNKQAQGMGVSLDEGEAVAWLDELENCYKTIQALYSWGLSIGVPKELARLPVSVGRYSQMRASTSLRNWLSFMTLRAAPNAQWEIQEYARAVGQLIAKAFPQTWEIYQKEQK